MMFKKVDRNKKINVKKIGNAYFIQVILFSVPSLSRFMFEWCRNTTKQAIKNSVNVKYKSKVTFSNGEYLNIGINVSAAAMKNIIIELSDTNLHNFNKITYKTKLIKKM